MKIISFYKVLILLAVFFAGSGFAQSNKVLIVNSDNVIYRYESIATEFKKVLQQNAYQWTEFKLDSNDNPEAEAELRQLIRQENPELIYCIGSKAYALVHNYVPDKKTIFSAAINWRKLELGPATYGVTNELSSAQEISLLHYFFPTVKAIGVLYNDSFSREYIEIIKKDALALGINLINQPVNNVSEVKDAFTELLPKIDMLWIIPDPVVLGDKQTVKYIFQTAQKQNKPVYAYSDVYTGQGAVLSISADNATIGRQAASLAMMVANGKMPENAMQNPAGSTITLNKCKLDTLQTKFNPDALDSVNTIVGCGEHD